LKKRYVDLSEMTNIIKQSFYTENLKEWCNTAGEMIWYFNTQQSPVDTGNNKDLLNYYGL